MTMASLEPLRPSPLVEHLNEHGNGCIYVEAPESEEDETAGYIIDASPSTLRYGTVGIDDEEAFLNETPYLTRRSYIRRGLGAAGAFLLGLGGLGIQNELAPNSTAAQLGSLAFMAASYTAGFFIGRPLWTHRRLEQEHQDALREAERGMRTIRREDLWMNHAELEEATRANGVLVMSPDLKLARRGDTIRVREEDIVSVVSSVPEEDGQFRINLADIALAGLEQLSTQEARTAYWQVADSILRRLYRNQLDQDFVHLRVREPGLRYTRYPIPFEERSERIRGVLHIAGTLAVSAALLAREELLTIDGLGDDLEPERTEMRAVVEGANPIDSRWTTWIPRLALERQPTATAA
ncbi:MAG TPA: hypothetical protein VGS28_04760 [Candidatus Saccharimonadales bacterium]|nr:hypothetical protein [Candidatus Saccharimonadales bacterium]